MERYIEVRSRRQVGEVRRSAQFSHKRYTQITLCIHWEAVGRRAAPVARLICALREIADTLVLTGDGLDQPQLAGWLRPLEEGEEGGGTRVCRPPAARFGERGGAWFSVRIEADLRSGLVPELERDPELHVWVSGNMDGLVHRMSVRTHRDGTIAEFYVPPEDMAQRDKALELEVYTVSDGEHGAAIRRSAGAACVPLLSLLAPSADREPHVVTLRTYGTDVVVKGACSVTLLEVTGREDILRAMRAAPDLLGGGALREYLDAVLLDRIDCAEDDDEGGDLLRPAFPACATTVLPAVLSRGGPILPSHFFGGGWNAAARVPPSERLWMRILNAVRWQIAGCCEENDYRLLGLLLTYDSTSRHYATDIIFDPGTGEAREVDVFSFVHVDGNGDCEDLTCNTLAWARWLCEMPVPQDPVLRRLQTLLATSYHRFAVLCDVTSPAVKADGESGDDDEEDGEIGAHLVTLLPPVQGAAVPPLVLESTGRCDPLAGGIDDTGRFAALHRVALALGDACDYYHPLTTYLSLSAHERKHLSSFYRYMVHAYDDVRQVIMLNAGDTQRYGAAYEDFAAGHWDVAAVPPPPDAALRESTARRTHMHPVPPIVEADEEAPLPPPGVAAPGETRVVVAACVDNLTGEMTARALARLREKIPGLRVGAVCTVMLFSGVGQHMLELFVPQVNK